MPLATRLLAMSRAALGEAVLKVSPSLATPPGAEELQRHLVRRGDVFQLDEVHTPLA